MWDYIKLGVLGAIAVLAAIAANYARDLAYMVNALTVMLAAGITFVWVLRRVDEPRAVPVNEYNDGVVRAGVIATALWGLDRVFCWRWQDMRAERVALSMKHHTDLV